jgi:hypothetical protein
MAGENNDSMAAILQSHGGVDDQPLGPADPEVGVEEDDVLLFVCFGHNWASQCIYTTTFEDSFSRSSGVVCVSP